MRCRAFAFALAAILVWPAPAAFAHPASGWPWQDLHRQQAPQADLARAALDRLDLPAPLSSGPGRDALARGQVRQALALFDRYLPYAPLGGDGELAELDRARALLAGGDTASAAAALRTFIHQWPGAESLRLASYALVAVLFRAGQYADALTALEQYRQQWPEADADAMAAAIGWSHLALGHFPAAETAFRQAIDKAGTSPLAIQAHLALGDTYWQWGRLQAAAQTYIRVGDATKDVDLQDRGHYLAGEAASQRRDWKPAIEQFKTVSHTPAWLRRARLAQAHALIEDQQPAAAQAVITPWITANARDPWLVAALHLSGLAHLAAADWTKAIDAFRRSVAADGKGPWTALALYGQAVAEFRLGQYADSASHCQRAIQIAGKAPVAALAQELLGEAHYQQGNYQAAIQHLAAPAVGGAGRRALGFAYYRSGEYLAAIQAWQSFADPEVVFYRAQAMLQAGQTEAAAREFLSYLKANPNSNRLQEALFGQGSALMRAGHYDEAIGPLSELESAARPEMARAARVMLAECLAALKRFDEARRTLEAIMAADPADGADAAYRIGWTWLQQGDSDKAMQAWGRYREHFPAHRQVGDALFNEGEILQRSKKFAAALDRYAAVLSHPASRPELRSQALMRSADAALAMGDGPRAMGYYEQIRQGFPERALEAERGGLRAQLAAAEPDGALVALKAYRQAHGDDTITLEVMDALGQKLTGSGRYDEAIALLSAHPRPGGATLYWLGRAQRGGGRTIEAEATFVRITEAREGFEVAALDQLAQMAFAAGRFDQAIERWQRLLAWQPAAGDSLKRQTRFNLALAQARANRGGEAEAGYRSLATDATVPKDQRLDAMRRLGTLLRERKRWDDAVSTYEQMAALAGKPAIAGAEARYWAGHSMAQAGRKADAVRLLGLVEGYSPVADPRWLAQALFKQGELYEEMAKWRLAITAYQRIASLKTDAAWRSDAQARVRWIQQHIPAKEIR
jgi:tetratricopeptide (TPR) repeat protein